MTADRPLAVTLENRLMGQGIYATDWSETEETIHIEYETVAPGGRVTSDEVGLVVRTLLAAVDEREGWSPKRLEATSRTVDGDGRGTWYVEAGWFEELYESIDEIEFSRRVLSTVEYASGGT